MALVKRTCPSEPELHSQLHRPLIVAALPRRRVFAAVKHECGDGISLRIGGDDSIDAGDIRSVEEVLRFEEQFTAHRVAERNEARVSQIEIDDAPEAPGVPLDTERTVVIEAILV